MDRKKTEKKEREGGKEKEIKTPIWDVIAATRLRHSRQASNSYSLVIVIGLQC